MSACVELFIARPDRLRAHQIMGPAAGGQDHKRTTAAVFIAWLRNGFRSAFAPKFSTGMKTFEKNAGKEK
jgi:hypothetical protein